LKTVSAAVLLTFSKYSVFWQYIIYDDIGKDFVKVYCTYLFNMMPLGLVLVSCCRNVSVPCKLSAQLVSFAVA